MLMYIRTSASSFMNFMMLLIGFSSCMSKFIQNINRRCSCGIMPDVENDSPMTSCGLSTPEVYWLSVDIFMLVSVTEVPHGSSTATKQPSTGDPNVQPDHLHLPHH
jgi:hypothetical protein